MTTLRPFCCDDLFKFNNVNLDSLTETYQCKLRATRERNWASHKRLTADAVLPRQHFPWQDFGLGPRFCCLEREVRPLDGRALSFGCWRELRYLAVRIMGKSEGQPDSWHGHVTALTVAPEYRRLGVAGVLMNWLEDISEKKDAWFVDLYVRVSNTVAISMYKSLGYTVYRTVLEYYSGDPDENAYDMRKALSRDIEKKSIIPLEHPVRLDDCD